MPWTSWHLGLWHQSCLPCLSDELAHHSLAPKISLLLHPLSQHPLLSHCSRNNLKEIASDLESQAVRGSDSSGCSDFLVPPLFFLNFIPLLVFLHRRIFLSPSLSLLATVEP